MDYSKQTAHLALIYGWTEQQVLDRIGDGPYVVYGGGPTPPPEGYNWEGIPVVHDPTMPFNCTRAVGTFAEAHSANRNQHYSAA